ncbi:MAG: YceI family protein [Streptosporangiaceae bacterium]
MSGAGTQALKPGSYAIDPGRSRVRFQARHMFGLGPVHGTFGIDRGEIVIAEPVTGSAAEAVILAGSFSTGNRMRDADVRSAKYLDTAAHPEIVFRSQRVEQSGYGWTLHGDLTVRGQAQPVSVVISSARGTEDGAAFEATTTIDRYAFGITKGKGMTGRSLTLTFDIVAAQH